MVEVKEKFIAFHSVFLLLLGHWSNQSAHQQVLCLSSFSTFGFRLWGILWTGVTNEVISFKNVDVVSPKINLKIQKWMSLFSIQHYKHVWHVWFSHASNPRMVTDFVSTTINEALDSSLSCPWVNEHLPIMEILELLQAESFILIGWRPGCRLSFW